MIYVVCVFSNEATRVGMFDLWWSSGTDNKRGANGYGKTSDSTG